MEPLGGGWRDSVPHTRPNFARPRLDRLLAVRGDRFLDAYPREAERRQAAGRFDLPLAMAFSLLLHGAIFLIPFPASNSQPAGFTNEASLPERRMVFLSLAGAQREAEPAPAAAHAEAAATAPTAAIPAADPLPAIASVPPDTAAEAAASPPAEMVPAAAQPEVVAAATAPAAGVTPTAAGTAEVAAAQALAQVEAQPADPPIAAEPAPAATFKPAPAATFKPASAAAALLARPGTSNTAAAVAAMAEAELPAFQAAAPLTVASGFFSPRADKSSDIARPADSGAPVIAAPLDSSISTGAFVTGDQVDAQSAAAGDTARRAARGAKPASSSGAGMAASGPRAIDDMAERQARTFSAAIRKGSLPGVAAPAHAPGSAPAAGNAVAFSNAAAHGEPAPASAVEPPATIEASDAATPDVPTEGLPAQTAASAAPAPAVPTQDQAQTPAQTPPPAPVAVAEPIAAAPAAVLPANVPEIPAAPAQAAPATPPAAAGQAAAEQAVPAQPTQAVPSTPAVPSPQEVLDLLSSLVAGRKAYPEAARRRKAQGSVGIALKVAADGSLAAAAIQKKSGSAILDRAALDLVKGLFPIALRPGEPMEVALSIEYRLVP